MKALLDAVRHAHPADDLPRLVFADWCDENGQPERAEFIRSSVTGVWAPYPSVGPPVRRYGRPLSREMYLHKLLLPGWKLYGWNPPAACYQHGPPDHTVTAMGSRLEVTWVRGFADVVRGRLACLRKGLPGLVRREPIRRIDVTDRRPYYLFPETDTLWFRGRMAAGRYDYNAHHLPDDLFDRIGRSEPLGEGYTDTVARFSEPLDGEDEVQTADAARAALSAALLAEAHELAEALP